MKSIKQDARNSQIITGILAGTPAVYLRWQQQRISIVKAMEMIIAVGLATLHDVRKMLLREHSTNGVSKFPFMLMTNMSIIATKTFLTDYYRH